MGIRHIGMVAGGIGIAACSGKSLEVGGGTAGASWGAAIAAAPPSVCDAGLSTGVGFIAGEPTECNSAPGTPHSVAASSDVASLLVGDWRTCGPYILPEGDVGIQFTADGHFMQLTQADDGSLVPVGSPGVTMGTAGASGSNSGGAMVSPSGTFTVVDRSATYGAGTFELHLFPDSGGIFEGEITITDSPRAFVFQYPNSRGLVYVPPAPWTPRANVCSACDSAPGGTPVDQDNPGALSADVMGRWIWCGGTGRNGAGGLVMGVEFGADGTWYWLVETVDGTLSRSTDPEGSGTFMLTQEMTGGQSSSGSVSDPAIGPHNLDLQFHDGNGELTQVVVTQNPRGLWLASGFSSTGGPLMYDYAYMSPLP